MSEILRRRALEAEVRRELMMEGEMALQRGVSGVPLGSPSPMVVESISPPLAETRNRSRFLMKEAKPIENISGAKRARSSEPLSDGNSKKKKKKKKKKMKVNGEWSCALCQVIAPSERNLNEHLGGKKHKKKEAAQQHAMKSSTIGLWTKKVAKPIKDPVTEVKRASEPLSFAKPGDASSATDGPWPLQGSLNSDNLNKDESVVTKKEIFQYSCGICEVCPPTKKAMEMHQQGRRHKWQLQNQAVERTCKVWCEACQVGPLSEKTMKVHQQGRKHKHQLQNRAVEKTVAEDGRAVKEWREKIMDKEGKDEVAV